MAKHKSNHPWVRKIKAECDQVTKSGLARDGLGALVAEAQFERERTYKEREIVKDMFRSGMLHGRIVNGGTYN